VTRRAASSMPMKAGGNFIDTADGYQCKDDEMLG
jgi:hypothetical protein